MINEQSLLRQLTRRAWYAQRRRCYHCSDPITLAQATGDHYPTPRYQGGKTRHGNIVAACHDCNNRRNQETNRRGGKLNMSVGDDTPRSPFEVLQQLKDKMNDDSRPEHSDQDDPDAIPGQVDPDATRDLARDESMG